MCGGCSELLHGDVRHRTPHEMLSVTKVLARVSRAGVGYHLRKGTRLIAVISIGKAVIKLHNGDKDRCPVAAGHRQVPGGKGELQVETAGEGFAILVTDQCDDSVKSVPDESEHDVSMAFGGLERCDFDEDVDDKYDLGKEFHESLYQIPVDKKSGLCQEDPLPDPTSRPHQS